MLKSSWGPPEYIDFKNSRTELWEALLKLHWKNCNSIWKRNKSFQISHEVVIIISSIKIPGLAFIPSEILHSCLPILRLLRIFFSFMRQLSPPHNKNVFHAPSPNDFQQKSLLLSWQWAPELSRGHLYFCPTPQCRAPQQTFAENLKEMCWVFRFMLENVAIDWALREVVQY